MSEFLRRVGEFLTADTTWWGSSSIPVRLWEHTWLTALSVGIAALLVLPLGIWLGHRRRGVLVASAVVNVGRSVPSFGILAIGAVWFIGVVGLGSLFAVPALVALAAPPMFTNAVTGMQTVPLEVREAAIGMGMTGRQLVRRVEMPLAAPIILEGIRIALVQVIATATLAALVAGGGLGRFIVDGFAKRRGEGELFVGAVLVAALAVLAERGFGRLERRLRPAGTGGGGQSPQPG